MLASGTRSIIQNNREKRGTANKEDVKHDLKEIWNFNPDETFYKIFFREAEKSMQVVLDLTREQLLDLTWREDNDYLNNTRAKEVDKIRNLKNYEVHF